MIDMNIEDIAMPGIGGKSTGNKINVDEYRVRYFKANLDEPGDLAELEVIETEAMLGREKILMSKDKFSFQATFYIVITFLEKR